MIRTRYYHENIKSLVIPEDLVQVEYLPGLLLSDELSNKMSPFFENIPWIKDLVKCLTLVSLQSRSARVSRKAGWSDLALLTRWPDGTGLASGSLATNVEK